jgi:hypothetical protein
VSRVRKHVVVSSILALCLGLVSCAKLNPTPTGPLTYETNRFVDAIPQDYGQLIGVTQNPEVAQLVDLWFQKSDGTIAAVSVNIREGKIGEKTLTIPRK